MPTILNGQYTARAILSSFSSDPGKLDGVKEEIDTYVDKLSKAIGRDLSNSLLTKVQFQRNVNWLLRLGLGETVNFFPLLFYTSHQIGVLIRHILQLRVGRCS